MGDRPKGAAAGPELTLPELARLREQTEVISAALHGQLAAHLETLRPLFTPRRILGKYFGGSAARDDVPGAEQVVAELEERYRAVAGAPFVLRPQLDRARLSSLESRIELYPWEYIHRAQDGGVEKAIKITSPFRWVMTFATDYSPSQLRDALAGNEEKRPTDAAQFVLNALVMRAVLERSGPLRDLLRDLRYDVAFEPADGLGELALAVVNSNLPSSRPSDQLLITATGLSGVPAFIELVDRNAIATIRDPLKERLIAATGSSGASLASKEID